MDTLYTFWDNITHYKTESVYFLGLINSAIRYGVEAFFGFISGLEVFQVRQEYFCVRFVLIPPVIPIHATVEKGRS